MLENSFIHLPGFGIQTEERLWSQGCRNWDDLENRLPELFGSQRVKKIRTSLEESRVACAAGELGYFKNLLKGSEMWRLVPFLIISGQADQIAYLDIETTGLGFPPATESTTIAVYFEGELHCEHIASKKQLLLEEINSQAKLLVTFNGASFDLPFLRREFDTLEFAQPHLDLRYWFAQLGRRGGLKKIQQSFPEIPQRCSMDIDGFDAVRLWRMHEHGVERALETLLTYNAEDTIVLEQLVYMGLNLEAERRPLLALDTYRLPVPPRIATRVCTQVYKFLRS